MKYQLTTQGYGEELVLEYDQGSLQSKCFNAQIGWVNPEWHDKEYHGDE